MTSESSKAVRKLSRVNFSGYVSINQSINYFIVRLKVDQLAY